MQEKADSGLLVVGRGLGGGGGSLWWTVTIGVAMGLTTSIMFAASPDPTSMFEALQASAVVDGAADTNGAVSRDFVVTPLNTGVLIQTKDGTRVAGSPITLGQFWSSAMPHSVLTDPVVVFDPFTNRWFFTTLSFGDSILIAASKSSNPDPSNWWKYRIPLPPGQTSADQPKIGFNGKWIAVQVDIFPPAAPQYSVIYLFDKGPLMAGEPPHLDTNAPNAPGQNYQVITGSGLQGISINPARTYDANAADLFLLQSSRGPFGVQHNVSAITYYKISGEYAASVSPDLPEGTEVFVAGNSWWSQFRNDQGAPQQGTSQLIQVNDDRINNCMYRNGSLWAAHTVFLPADSPPSISAVQWWQISPAASPQFRVVQHGLIGGPPDSVFRGFPSLAVNANESVLIGYAAFSLTSYPSGNYSFRFRSDPLGTLQSGEGQVRSGNGPYERFPSNPCRWGDFSAAVVDPINDRDMWTVQEFSGPTPGPQDNPDASSSPPARLWSTYWIGISQTFGRFAAGLLYGFGRREYQPVAGPPLALSAAGQNANGQLGNNESDDSNVPVGVASLTRFSHIIDIAAGDYNTLAVDKDGTVYAWGSNEYGQLGNGDSSPYPAPDDNPSPTTVPGLHLFKPDGASSWYYTPVSTSFGDSRHILSSGFGTCAAVDYLGRVFTWGINYNGQLGDGTLSPHYTPQHVRKDLTQLPLTDVVSIAAGDGQMVALKSDGTVWAWGSGCRGALGDGNLTCHDQLYPIQVKKAPVPGGTPSPLTNIAHVVCGGSGFALALTDDGNVYGWGANGAYQLGLHDQTDRAYATFIFSGADRIAAGAYHSLLHSRLDGLVYAWGYNGYGQCARGVSGGYQEYPFPMVTTNNVGLTASDIAAGGYFSLVIRTGEQTVYGTGDNVNGQLATGNNASASVLTLTGYHP